jgi:hypothetical protein
MIIKGKSGIMGIHDRKSGAVMEQVKQYPLTYGSNN